jgi:RNA polymerase sigma-70 factor (ECF subfamily)
MTAAGPEPPSDQSLMRRLAARDDKALEELYDRYSRLIFSVLLRITGQAELAEELLQETFLRLWRNAESYHETRGELRPWLLTVARNLAFDHRRTKVEQQRQREFHLEIVPALSGGPPTEELYARRERVRQVREVIGTLPSSQQRALHLAYFEGMSQSEIARAMDEPLGTVKTWVRTALHQLREQLGATA